MLFVLLGCAMAALDLDSTVLLQTTQSEFDDFQGSIEIGEEGYTAECDCTEQGLEDIEEVKCQPSKIKLVENIEGEGASYEEITEKLEGYSTFEWARVTRSSFRCLDGRISDPMLGIPGGDAGELFLGIWVFQDLTGIDLTQEDVDYYLDEYLKCMSMTSFYICTDQDAIDHAAKELALDDLDIFNPDEDIQDKLLDTLVEPNNIGDTHFKMLVEYPDLYNVNKTTVEMFIKSYYKVLWDDENTLQSSLYLDILEGSHEEEAFLEIRTSAQCRTEQVAPLISPTDDDLSVLVNHLDAVKPRRDQIAQFFARVGEVDRKEMTDRLNHYGMLFLDVTGSYVGKDLPFYTAEFV